MKNNSKLDKMMPILALVVGIIIGGSVSVGVCAASAISSKAVLYNNDKSNVNASNVKEALDELYTKKQS